VQIHLTDNFAANTHHRGVHDPRISTRRGNLALFRNIGQFHHHLAAGDPNLIESSPAIIFVVESEFGTHVTSLDTGQVLEGVPVSELDNERVHTVVLTTDYEPGHSDCVGGVAAHFAGPVLGRGESGGVNHELIRLLIEGRCSLEAGNIRSVAKLSLSIGT